MIECPRCGKQTTTSPCDVCHGHFRAGGNSTAVLAAHIDKVKTRCFTGVANENRNERDPERLVGSQSLSGYQFDSCLLQGGMGHTWRAHRISDGEELVIKAPRWQDGDAQLRFTREARALASLDSPYILNLIDIDMSIDHQPLLILQLLRGQTIREALSKADMTSAEFERLACHMARAIEHCHRRGIIHRDIKPENIMIHEDQYILIDFSLALVGKTEVGPVIGGTPSGAMLGTPPYAAPEQLRNPSEVSYKADIYSYGILLRECLEHCRLDTFTRYRLKQWAHLIKSLCHHKQEKRPDLKDVIHHCQIFTIQQRHHPKIKDRVPKYKNNKGKNIFIISILIITLSLTMFFLMIPTHNKNKITREGSIDPNTPDIIKLDTHGIHNFTIKPLDNTRIRLPGSGKWRHTSIHITNYNKSIIEVHIIDSDNIWNIEIEKF